MVNIFGIMSGVFGPVISLNDKYKQYRKNKRTKEEFANAFEAEANDYVEIWEEASDLAVNEFAPALKELDDPPTRTQLLDIFGILSQTPRILCRFVQSFINLAKACKELQSEKAFMNNLMEADPYLHDFVDRMAEAYIEKNTVRIDGKFLRFFSTYKKELLKGTKLMNKGLSNADKKEFEDYRKTIRRLVRYMNSTNMAKYRRTPIVRTWARSLNQLGTMSKNVELMETKRNMRAFIPEAVQPLMDFFDEFW